MSFIVLAALMASMGAGCFMSSPLTVMKQKMCPYFHNITPGAIAEAAPLIAHSLSVEHIQTPLAPGACGHESSSVCLLYKNAHKQIALKPFMAL